MLQLLGRDMIKVRLHQVLTHTFRKVNAEKYKPSHTSDGRVVEFKHGAICPTYANLGPANGYTSTCQWKITSALALKTLLATLNAVNLVPIQGMVSDIRVSKTTTQVLKLPTCGS
jgi:hypothetical protein